MIAGATAAMRRVTFASGIVLDEMIVSIDDHRHRLAWTIKGVEHHNGVLQIFEQPGGVRVAWTADVLPAELAERFSPLMARGLELMKKTLEASCQG